ncbi:MAG: SDR family oxidoreductase [Actinomycetota bacterium]|nr:SDR family oxidoreductase [Actinomycetota bacterium]
MRVLVTGHDGYIGTVLMPMLEEAGHVAVGLDTYLYRGCVFGTDASPVESIRGDVRDVRPGDLEGFDAVVHLAAISNDPLGDLNPECTYAINHHGSVHLAAAAKAAGVTRFLFSSSCSLYGSHGDAPVDELADFRPVTPYGRSKVLAEHDLSLLAGDDFSPTFLRNATVYGVSPRLRGDLVVNNLTGFAVTTGRVFLKSDGTSWRPLVHVEDVARAFLAVLEADRDRIHDEAFNVGTSEENYRIRDVAEIVRSVVPGSSVVLSNEAFDDLRNYRVNCDKLANTLPAFLPEWNVRRGVTDLFGAYVQEGLRLDDLEGSRFGRVRRVRDLRTAGRLDEELRWTSENEMAPR